MGLMNTLTIGDQTGVISLPYAICSTAAATAAKTCSFTNFSLTSGAHITVNFTYANTASSPTLNVNSTGAKTIRYAGATLSSSQYWAAGQVVDFVYDGTYWNVIGANKDNNYYFVPSFISGLQVSSSNSVPSGRHLYVPYATATQYGVSKVANVRSSSITAASGVTTDGRYRGVEMDADGKLFVSIPSNAWTLTDDDGFSDLTYCSNGLFSQASSDTQGIMGFTYDSTDGTTYLIPLDSTSARDVLGLGTASLLEKNQVVSAITISGSTLRVQSGSGATTNLTLPTSSGTKGLVREFIVNSFPDPQSFEYSSGNALVYSVVISYNGTLYAKVFPFWCWADRTVPTPLDQEAKLWIGGSVYLYYSITSSNYTPLMQIRNANGNNLTGASFVTVEGWY